ncbi:MAG: 3-dehydroquinate synthase [Bacteroidota bacterium]
MSEDYICHGYNKACGKHISVYTIIIPAGEKQKNITRADAIYTQLLRWKIERNSTVIALGGGVIGDLAGFIAATFQRGVKFVQIPTSLLAQVDSSVGGKTGINHPLAKNMIGAFYQPAFVLADTEVLATLPSREIVSGLGEIIKYGIILDRKFFTFVSSHLFDVLRKEPSAGHRMVQRSCELKAYVVSSDEREQGLRAILNFGHTVGHALEHAGKYSLLKHGEAILYGMLAEAKIAEMRNLLMKDQFDIIESAIRSLPLPRLSKLSLKNHELLATMKMDKKVVRGDIRMVLPSAIGRVSLPVAVAPSEIKKSIDWLKKL